MNRLIGILLVFISLLPMAALLVVYLVWARHVYTVGFSADARGVTTLAVLLVGDVVILVVGIYLLRRGR